MRKTFALFQWLSAAERRFSRVLELIRTCCYTALAQPALHDFQGSSHETPSTSTPIVLNARGQIAFKNGQGLWATDCSGQVQIIAQPGQTVDLDNGPGEKLETINNIFFFANSGNQDGKSSGFNDRGELTFYAGFGRSQSGVFASTIVMVPEPPASVLALLGLALLGPKLRTRRDAVICAGSSQLAVSSAGCTPKHLNP